MKTKALSILLALILLAMPLYAAACETGGGDGTGDISTVEETVPESILDIVVNGKSEFTVVRPDETEQEIIDAMLKVSKNIETYTGASLQVKSDFIVPTQPEESRKYEILVGKTNRAESAEALEGLRSRDYVVGVYGTKIVIAGITAESTERAVEVFIDKFLMVQGSKGEKAGNLTMKESENIKYEFGSYRISSCEILGAPVTSFSIVYPYGGVYSAERAARTFAYALMSGSGYALTVTDDREEEASGGNYEIVFGETKHGGTAVTEKHGYSVTASGKKLYVNAENLYGYLAAYEYLTETLFYNGEVRIEEGFKYTGKAETFTGGSEYVNTRLGEYRVIFNNILGNCDTSVYPVPTRNLMISELHIEYAPDVIGLQECSPNSRGVSSYIMQMKKAGYEEVKVTASNSTGVNYTPLMYRTDRLKVIESGYHLYSDGAGDKSKSITWAVFESIGNGERFAVCSTHFYYTGDALGESARLLDAAQLLTVAEKINTKYGCTVIAGGDLNCNVSSAPYAALMNGGFTGTQATAPVTENLKTHHSYPEFNTELKYYDTMTFSTGAASTSIDHALIYKNGSATLKLYDVITDEYALLSSDHCPVLIDFDIN